MIRGTRRVYGGYMRRMDDSTAVIIKSAGNGITCNDAAWPFADQNQYLTLPTQSYFIISSGDTQTPRERQTGITTRWTLYLLPIYRLRSSGLEKKENIVEKRTLCNEYLLCKFCLEHYLSLLYRNTIATIATNLYWRIAIGRRHESGEYSPLWGHWTAEDIVTNYVVICLAAISWDWSRGETELRPNCEARK